MIDATADWRRVAGANGIDGPERNRFEPAFEDLRDAIIEITSIGAGSGQRDPSNRQPRVPRGRADGGRFAPRDRR